MFGVTVHPGKAHLTPRDPYVTMLQMVSGAWPKVKYTPTRQTPTHYMSLLHELTTDGWNTGQVYVTAAVS